MASRLVRSSIHALSRASGEAGHERLKPVAFDDQLGVEVPRHQRLVPLSVLSDRPRWGGRRAGAGRKPAGKTAGMPHVPRPAFRRTVPAHVTVRLRPDLPSLRNTRIVREVERTFAAGCERSDFRLV